ncbi:MAG: hypothetical protein ACK4VV_13640, partial [Pseudomonas sp.]
SDDDIEDDDLDDVGSESDVDDLPDEVENDEIEEPTSKPKKKAPAADDPLEGLSVEAKAREREMLEKQIAEFMARGGKVQEVGANVVGDPPKKPDSKYGSRPI